MAGRRAPFPNNPEDFASDTRISFSKAADNYILEDENSVLNLKFVDGLRLAQVQLLQSHRPWRNPNISAFCVI
jgi:hypothetical protein